MLYTRYNKNKNNNIVKHEFHTLLLQMLSVHLNYYYYCYQLLFSSIPSFFLFAIRQRERQRAPGASDCI